MALSARDLRARGAQGVRIHAYPVSAWNGDVVLLRELHGLQIHEWDSRNEERRKNEAAVLMDKGTAPEHMVFLSLVEIELDEDTLQREQAKLSGLVNERSELLQKIMEIAGPPPGNTPELVALRHQLDELESRIPPAIGLDVTGHALGPVKEVFRGTREDREIVRAWGAALSEIYQACITINRMRGEDLENVRKNLSRTRGRDFGATSPIAPAGASENS